MGCTKSIIYNYNPNVNEFIIKEIQSNLFPILTKKDRELSQFYVMIIQDGGITNMYFNTYNKSLPAHYAIIKKSNRYLKLGKYKIPIIFETDFKIRGSLNQEQPISPYIGYFISIDGNNNIIKSYILQ